MAKILIKHGIKTYIVTDNYDHKFFEFDIDIYGFDDLTESIKLLEMLIDKKLDIIDNDDRILIINNKHESLINKFSFNIINKDFDNFIDIIGNNTLFLKLKYINNYIYKNIIYFLLPKKYISKKNVDDINNIFLIDDFYQKNMLLCNSNAINYSTPFLIYSYMYKQNLKKKWFVNGGITKLKHIIIDELKDSGHCFFFNRNIDKLHYNDKNNKIDGLCFTDGTKLLSNNVVLDIGIYNSYKYFIYEHVKDQHIKNEIDNIKVSHQNFYFILEFKINTKQLKQYNKNTIIHTDSFGPILISFPNIKDVDNYNYTNCTIVTNYNGTSLDVLKKTLLDILFTNFTKLKNCNYKSKIYFRNNYLYAYTKLSLCSIIHPKTIFENLYITGPDLTYYTFYGSILSSYITAISILNYGTFLNYVTENNIYNFLKKK